MSETYFRQWLSGRDFATDNALAREMRNFTYALGDPDAHEAVLVDPAYDPASLFQLLARDDMTLVGVIATHYHADHIGGTLLGHPVAGIRELMEIREVPVHVNVGDESWVNVGTGVTSPPVVPHADGDVVTVGSLELRLRHTPGHTAGSQCVEVAGRLLTGDTLFLDGCGRTDLPGSDPSEMYRSLQIRLADLDDDLLVYPGHFYSPETSATLRAVRARNQVLAERSAEEWLRVFA
ncbi:MAG: MBL fold metallo-hydrolase [Acidobacteria bacterium]|nr:MBL fold metallo-hydrolase [Acidobacteriota bacterium]